MQSTTPGPAQWSSGTTSGGTYRWMPPPSSCCFSLRWPHLVNISPRTCRLHLICILRTLLSHKSPKKFWCEKPKLIGRSKNSDDIIILKCICLHPSGLHIIYTQDEVDVVQNLMFYIEAAYKVAVSVYSGSTNKNTWRLHASYEWAAAVFHVFPLSLEIYLLLDLA